MKLQEEKDVSGLMGIYRTTNIETLKTFARRRDQLGIVEREVPAGAKVFFAKLMQTPFGIFGEVRKKYAQKDIRNILAGVIPAGIKNDPFYGVWIADMAEVSRVFCDTQGTDSIRFWLGTKRGCRRYHIDNVPMRMLVTYAGKGTEWIPDEAADREAFASGEPNEKILIDKSALQFMNAWDVSVFRGGANGLLHRTPDDALNGPSILMRLDHPSCWENMMKRHKQSELAQA